MSDLKRHISLQNVSAALRECAHRSMSLDEIARAIEKARSLRPECITLAIIAPELVTLSRQDKRIIKVDGDGAPRYQWKPLPPEEGKTKTPKKTPVRRH